jgi:hypothetical protein
MSATTPWRMGSIKRATVRNVANIFAIVCVWVDGKGDEDEQVVERNVVR